MTAPAHLAYAVHPGRGPHLLLLHGFLSSSAQWLHNLQPLSEVCQPVTVDLWGHGRSPAPSSAKRYHPLSYVDELEHIRRELGADRWFLCGYSLGAGITMRYAHLHPERVLGHGFTNSTSGFADPAQMAAWKRGAEQSAQHILDGGLPAIERIPVHPKFARRLPPDIYQALLEDAARLSPTGIANTLRQTTPYASARDIAPANARPALLCFGTHEKRFHAHKIWASEHMPALHITELNAGHAVNMEDAAGFNQAWCDFMRAHTP